jgi:hypothetical protein
MPQDATARRNWKVGIVQWAEGLTGSVAKPVRKLVGESVLGILTSGSVRLSAMARSLREPIGLHATEKRLSRMLADHPEVAEAVTEETLRRTAPAVTEGMVLAIDPGDLNRDGAPASEGRSRVRDGSTGEVVGGFPLLSIVARDTKRGRTLPLLTRLYSVRSLGHRSENAELKAAITRISAHLGTRPLWVMDRGGDRGELWRFWLERGDRVLVRACDQRHWQWHRSQRLTAQQIARKLPCKHRGQIGEGKTVHFGITTVRMPELPDHPLSLLVVRHGKREPMVLVTTDRIRGHRQGQRLIRQYMDRWACEEGYRLTKQGFELERVQARKLASLRNLVALAHMAWALLAVRDPEGQRLSPWCQSLKPGSAPNFLFYRLLQGWQRLFQTARTGFYGWFRQRQPDPLIADLFPQTPAECRRLVA